MNQKISRARKRKNMEEHIKAWRLEDISQAKYCIKHKLKTKSFAYYKGRMEKQKNIPVKFVPVSISRPQKTYAVSPLKLTIDNRFTVEIGNENFNTEALKTLIKILGEV